MFQGELLTVIEQFPYPGLFLLLILGGVGFPFPEDAILLLCGFLISRAMALPLPAVVVVYAGVVVSDFLLFSLGRKYGRRIVTHKRFHRILPYDRLIAIEEKFKKYGVLLIFFGRHIWGVRSKIFLAAGIMGMPAHKFLLADLAASLITVAVMVTAGYTGGRAIEGITFPEVSVELIVIALLVTMAATLLISRLMRRQPKEVRLLPDVRYGGDKAAMASARQTRGVTE